MTPTRDWSTRPMCWARTARSPESISPNRPQAVNHYPIAPLDEAPNPAAAKAFITLVTGPTGQKVLAGAGFGPPSA